MGDRISNTAGAVTASPGRPGRILSKAELRQWRPDRDTFMALPRRPIMVVLDRVRRNRDLGSIFRLCDGFLANRLVICGTKVEAYKVVKAAAGAQHWVPWESAESCAAVVAAAKAAGAWVLVAAHTTTSFAPAGLVPTFPACLVLGSEKHGVAQEVVDLADAAVTIPIAGMATQLNVAANAAILLDWLSALHRPTAAAPQR
jgi:23S rRNA (guanosine2251-2'-O)-methyltransferase